MLEMRSETMAELKFLSEKNEDYSTSRVDKKKQEHEEEEAYVKIDLTRPHL
jgi:hypothetical protein